MTDRLKGKVAIITGGNAGIGRAAVERFCEEGAQVAFMARREAEGRAVEAAVRAAGGDATFIPCDVTERASLETAVQAAIDAYGRLDILVNNAGGGLPGEFPRESLQVWEDVLRLNLTAPFLMTRICWDHLVQSGNGVVLNVSSSAAVNAHTAETRKWMEFVSPASYHAAKAGLEAFTRYVAGAGSEHNVRANVVRPGLIATDATINSKMVDADFFRILQTTQRRGQPDDIAWALVYLASDEGGYVNGAVLTVDGGLVAKL